MSQQVVYQNERAESSSSLMARIVAAPITSAPESAHAAVTAWLADNSHRRAGRVLKDLLDGSERLRALIAGLADGSPFLWELVRTDPERLLVLLQSDPDAHFPALLAIAATAVAGARDEAEAMRLLRRAKAEAALLTALCDIGGVGR